MVTIYEAGTQSERTGDDDWDWLWDSLLWFYLRQTDDNQQMTLLYIHTYLDGLIAKLKKWKLKNTTESTNGKQWDCEDYNLDR